MNVGQVCGRPPGSAAASSSLMDVAASMRDHNIGAVAITKAPPQWPVAVGI